MQINYNLMDHFNFLEPSFLQQLKKQCSARIKPSKSILDALKHSQNINKQLKLQNQQLIGQLSHSKKQIEILKKMLENYTIQLHQFKFFKENKLQKFYQNQTQMKMKIQSLEKQIFFLKKQNYRLKNQRTSLNSKSSQQLNTLNKKYSTADDFDDEQIQHQNIIFQNRQICQTAKFHQYVNYNDQDMKNANKQTQVSSNIQILLTGQSNQNKHNYQNQQLMKMLQLAHSSRDIQKEQQNLYNQYYYLDNYQEEQQKPKIKQIVSQNQLTGQIQDKNPQMIENPIPKVQIKETQQPTLLITFQPNKCLKTQNNQTTNKELVYENANTIKSIQQRLLIKQPGFHQLQSIKILASNKNNQNNEIETIQNIQDMSNCDYNGLLDDINQGPYEDIPPFIDPSQLQQNQLKKKPISFKSFNIKQTVSLQVQSNQKIQQKKKKLIKKKQAIRVSKLNQNLQPEQNKVSFQQNRYNHVTQSYKTIDLQEIQNARQVLNKKTIASSILNDDSRTDQSVIIVLVDPRKSSKSKDKLKKNQQSSSNRSQGQKSSNDGYKRNNSRIMINSRIMTNQKYSMFNNRRVIQNKRHQSPHFKHKNNQPIHSSQLVFMQNNNYMNDSFSRSQLEFKTNNKNVQYNNIQDSQFIDEIPILRKKSSSSNNLVEVCSRKRIGQNNDVGSMSENYFHQ